MFTFTVEATLCAGNETYKKAMDVDLLDEEKAMKQLREIYLSAILTHRRIFTEEEKTWIC